MRSNASPKAVLWFAGWSAWLLALGACPARAAEEERALVVKLAAGQVRGAWEDRTAGLRAYRGIPFAQPPVGALRWRPPLPVEPWTGVRECVAFGSACLQPKVRIVAGPAGEQSEDCLHLNVWTSARDAAEKRPVMVWIHGGGFSIGSGSMEIHNGRAFAASGAVAVTINYRLGPFGFMAHPALSAEDPIRASGNYGLLDQVAALQWVHDNIAAFGGDPGNVTIFGESAGGVSVGCLLVSPLAKGLFHRAILESGVAGECAPLRGTAKPPGMSAEEQGIAIAERLGVEAPAGATMRTAEALRAMPAAEVLTAANPKVGLFGKGEKLWPCIDGRVLPDQPLKLIEAGNFNRVPVIVGANADEGTLFLRQLPVESVLAYKLLTQVFFKAHADRVLELFPAKSRDEVQPALARQITAFAFVASARRLARLLDAQKSPVWYYHFTRAAPLAVQTGMGATHGAEVYYVFKSIPEKFKVEAADYALAETMHAAWLRFARAGDPNGGTLPAWPVYSKDTDTHLEWGDTVRTGQGLMRKACDLLDEIAADKTQAADALLPANQGQTPEPVIRP
ncbi:MAG: carboxylesterase family protein [Planctomycetota bacterium]|nr:carboxylesterase family protein [Planctomycetota bacterium]